MSKINTRILTFATIILWLVTADAISAFAHEGPMQSAPRAAMHRHTAHARAVGGYAGSADSVVQDVDLPSSVCAPGVKYRCRSLLCSNFFLLGVGF